MSKSKIDVRVFQVFTYECVHSLQSSLLGQVLTIVDASLASGSQNKAVKDVIRKAFYDCDGDLMRIAEMEAPEIYPFSQGKLAPLGDGLVSVENS
jgi:hypothetical protein